MFIKIETNGNYQYTKTKGFMTGQINVCKKGANQYMHLRDRGTCISYIRVKQRVHVP